MLAPFVVVAAVSVVAMVHVQVALCIRGTHDVFDDGAHSLSFPRPFQFASHVFDRVSSGACSSFFFLFLCGRFGQCVCPELTYLSQFLYCAVILSTARSPYYCFRERKDRMWVLFLGVHHTLADYFAQKSRVFAFAIVHVVALRALLVKTRPHGFDSKLSCEIGPLNAVSGI